MNYPDLYTLANLKYKIPVAYSIPASDEDQIKEISRIIVDHYMSIDLKGTLSLNHELLNKVGSFKH